MRLSLCALFLTLNLLSLQDPLDHSDKPCLVTEVVTEGVRSDCHGWKPAKGEKMFAPAEVNKQLRVGDTFYFVWMETRWVATLKLPEKTTNCTAYGYDSRNAVLLKCDDAQQSELLIPLNEWPKEWHGPQLGWAYHVDEKGQALSSFAEFAEQERIRARVLRDIMNQRIPPLQASGRP